MNLLAALPKNPFGFWLHLLAAYVSVTRNCPSGTDGFPFSFFRFFAAAAVDPGRLRILPFTHQPFANLFSKSSSLAKA